MNINMLEELEKRGKHYKYRNEESNINFFDELGDLIVKKIEEFTDAAEKKLNHFSDKIWQNVVVLNQLVKLIAEFVKLFTVA